MPLLTNWQQFSDEQPTKNNVRFWWKSWPNANVGLCLGPVLGLIALDVDGESGARWVQQHEAEIPPTLEFITGHGRRLLFAYPTGFDVPNSNLCKDAHGEVRVLADGRQTVMPPSVHANGVVYRWEEGRGPGEIEPATCPEWLLDLLVPPPDPEPEDPRTSARSGQDSRVRERRYRRSLP